MSGGGRFPKRASTHPAPVWRFRGRKARHASGIALPAAKIGGGWGNSAPFAMATTNATCWSWTCAGRLIQRKMPGRRAVPSQRKEGFYHKESVNTSRIRKIILEYAAINHGGGGTAAEERPGQLSRHLDGHSTEIAICERPARLGTSRGTVFAPLRAISAGRHKSAATACPIKWSDRRWSACNGVETGSFE